MPIVEFAPVMIATLPVRRGPFDGAAMRLISGSCDDADVPEDEAA
jgi:hypothetical protein